MKLFLPLLLVACNTGPATKQPTAPLPVASEKAEKDLVPALSYTEIKNKIRVRQKAFADSFTIHRWDPTFRKSLTRFWVEAVGQHLYQQWKGTPWDFNGTTTEPQQGTIACGFFVTAILRDMNLQIDRRKLAVCASSVMMKALTPGQQLKKLDGLSYTGFNDSLRRLGEGVYIIGLDYHTGFIVNDSSGSWFIHSNYINRAGVVKEEVSGSAALQYSKIKWLVSLTGDQAFLQKWLSDLRPKSPQPKPQSINRNRKP